MILLGIETSGKVASVAVCDEEKVISQTSVYTKLTHSQVIMPICENVLKNAALTLSDIDGIVVSNGPGSYTGLRIGISAVKGMCFALGKKCLGVSTLKSLAYNFYGFSGVICSVMKARADLLYVAFFRSNGKEITYELADEILPISQIVERINSYNEKVILVGDAASELYSENDFSGENIVLAPPHLRLTLASSLCYASFGEEFYSADKLNAEYLQPTKAEKDNERS